MMYKQKLLCDRSKDLFMCYDKEETFCFYVVCIGNLKTDTKGNLIMRNVLYKSNSLNDCLAYWKARGDK